jgi:hypothetical protein
MSNYSDDERAAILKQARDNASAPRHAATHTARTAAELQGEWPRGDCGPITHVPLNSMGGMDAWRASAAQEQRARQSREDKARALRLKDAARIEAQATERIRGVVEAAIESNNEMLAEATGHALAQFRDALDYCDQAVGQLRAELAVQKGATEFDDKVIDMSNVLKRETA